MPLGGYLRADLFHHDQGFIEEEASLEEVLLTSSSEDEEEIGSYEEDSKFAKFNCDNITSELDTHDSSCTNVFSSTLEATTQGDSSTLMSAISKNVDYSSIFNNEENESGSEDAHQLKQKKKRPPLTLTDNTIDIFQVEVLI